MLSFSIRALHVFKVIRLIAVGTVMGKRCVGTKTIFVDIQTDGLCQYTVATNFGIAGDSDNGTVSCGRLVGDDVDNTCDGVATI